MATCGFLGLSPANPFCASQLGVVQRVLPLERKRGLGVDLGGGGGAAARGREGVGGAHSAGSCGLSDENETNAPRQGRPETTAANTSDSVCFSAGGMPGESTAGHGHSTRGREGRHGGRTNLGGSISGFGVLGLGREGREGREGSEGRGGQAGLRGSWK